MTSRGDLSQLITATIVACGRVEEAVISRAEDGGDAEQLGAIHSVARFAVSELIAVLGCLAGESDRAFEHQVHFWLARERLIAEFRALVERVEVHVRSDEQGAWADDAQEMDLMLNFVEDLLK